MKYLRRKNTKRKNALLYYYSHTVANWPHHLQLLMRHTYTDSLSLSLPLSLSHAGGTLPHHLPMLKHDTLSLSIGDSYGTRQFWGWGFGSRFSQ